MINPSQTDANNKNNSKVNTVNLLLLAANATIRGYRFALARIFDAI